MMKYLSLFSGIGTVELAFKKVFPDAICVGFSEIDPTALAVYRKHFPDHVNFGDVTKIDVKKLPYFDMMVFGSPCTDLSSFQFANLGWEGTRSVLFYDALKILRHCKPKYFLMENVASMEKQKCKDISKELGVEPILIDSVCFGAGHRRRYYWANFPIPVPIPDVTKPPHTADILQKNVPITKRLELKFKGLALRDRLPETPGICYNISHHNHKYYLPRADNKCNPVLTTQSLLNIVWDGTNLRYMTSIEIERLQTLPDDYTKFGSFLKKGSDKYEDVEIVKTKRHKLVGNAFHLATIEYILGHLKFQSPFPKGTN